MNHRGRQVHLQYGVIRLERGGADPALGEKVLAGHGDLVLGDPGNPPGRKLKPVTLRERVGQAAPFLKHERVAGPVDREDGDLARLEHVVQHVGEVAEHVPSPAVLVDLTGEVGHVDQEARKSLGVGTQTVGVAHDLLLLTLGLAQLLVELHHLLGLSAEPLKPDGVSLALTFHGDDPWPDRLLPIQAYNGAVWRGVRSNRFCLQSRFDPKSGRRLKSFLFDVTTDPKETTDVAAVSPYLTLILVSWYFIKKF